jgi:hypothetical protein
LDGGELYIEEPMQEYETLERCQAVQLSASDRHVLLTASFRLFLRRLTHNLPVLREDVLRVATYADESGKRAA